MLTTKRKPASVGEILTEEFMEPLGLTRVALAQAMGVPLEHADDLCNDCRTVTAATALILARVFGNTPEFWLNTHAAPTSGKPSTTPRNANASSARGRWRLLDRICIIAKAYQSKAVFPLQHGRFCRLIAQNLSLVLAVVHAQQNLFLF